MNRFSSKARWTLALCLVALLALAIGVSGAYFSDSKAGEITGTLGSIKVTGSGGSGGNNLDIAFTNLLPGEPQYVTANYQNTGTSPEDVWVVFPNADALHAINDLGNYGEVTVASEAGVVFHSVNLNDRPNNGTYPMPNMIRLRQNVAPGDVGTMQFTFAYASMLGTASHSSGGGVWNSYPVTQAQFYPAVVGSTPTNGPAGAGLPYKIVATQVGQQP